MIHTMRTALKFEHVIKLYDAGAKDPLVAVRDVNLDLEEGEICCLIGPSGCGKTTLLNLAAGFVPVTSGRVLVDGVEVVGPHSRCGVAFQADAVFPWMTVIDNVAYGLKWNGTPPNQRTAVARTYLERVGLTAYANRWPRQLSGGMRKRVDLARAFAFNPPILLLDEPFGSLDVLTKEEVQQVLLNVWRTDRKTIMFVTHDVEEAVYLGQRIAVMSRRPGRIQRIFQVPFSLDERAPDLKTSARFVEVRRAVRAALETPVEQLCDRPISDHASLS